MIISYPEAIAFIGSLAVVCLTILKLIAMRLDKKRDNIECNAIKELDKRFDVLHESVTINTFKIGELNKLHDKFDKLNNLLLKLLSDK